MELKLSEKLEFPVKSIVSSVDVSQVENFSAFSAVRLAKRYFEKLGFFVAEGADFEENFSFYFFDADRLFYDEYTKVKLGKSRMNDARKEYCSSLLEVIPETDVRLLLMLCRFCSYAGAPGFPDLILLKSGKWSTVYVMFDELSESQKLFLLLSRIVGVEPRIVELAAEEKEDRMEVDPFLLFSSILGDRRAKSIMEGLEENIRETEQRLGASSCVQKKSWEDELEYLTNERSKNPLFLFRKWKSQSFTSSSELKGFIHFVMTHCRNDFETYLEQLKGDEAFARISGKTEDAMKQKAEYMQGKFGIGQSRSKLLLNFF